MTATMSTLSTNDNATIYEVALPADKDSYEITVGNATVLGLDSVGSLTSDEIKVYMSSLESPTTEYVQYKVNGANPFSSSGTSDTKPNDFIAGIDIHGVRKIKILRNGAADSTGVKMNVILS